VLQTRDTRLGYAEDRVITPTLPGAIAPSLRTIDDDDGEPFMTEDGELLELE
jgi:hypothetical protein